MEPIFTGMLANEHHLDLLAEATREQLAACAARRRMWRTRLGAGLVRLGQLVTPTPDPDGPRVLTRQPCTAC
jgi:hypothetical protein